MKANRPVLISLAILMVVAIAAPLIGSTHIDLSRAFARVSPDYDILFFARLPRVLLALLAGAALSVTGVLFQCMLRDPLAEPYTLGVSAGRRWAPCSESASDSDSSDCCRSRARAAYC